MREIKTKIKINGKKPCPCQNMKKKKVILLLFFFVSFNELFNVMAIYWPTLSVNLIVGIQLGSKQINVHWVSWNLCGHTYILFSSVILLRSNEQRSGTGINYSGSHLFYSSMFDLQLPIISVVLLYKNYMK